MADIPIPARGKARVLGEFTGEYGGRSSMQRRRSFKNRKFKRENRPENSFWLPWSQFGNVSTIPAFTAAGVGEYITENTSSPIAIAPAYMLRDAFTLEFGGGSGSIAATNMMGSWKTCKLKRFQGAIHVFLHQYDAFSDVNNMLNVPIFIQWLWKKQDITPAATVPANTNEDVLDGGVEQYQNMATRENIAWDHRIIQRVQPTGQWSTAADVYNRMEHTFPSHFKLPFPRLGRQGLRLTNYERLVLYIQCRRHVVGSPGFTGTDGWLKDENKPVIFPHFRTLVSVDD